MRDKRCRRDLLDIRWQEGHNESVGKSRKKGRAVQEKNFKICRGDEEELMSVTIRSK